jgi:hypothetical protein
MTANCIIADDTSRFGEWLDVIALDDPSAFSDEELLVMSDDELKMRRSDNSIQALCQKGRDPTKVLLAAKQALADLVLRKAITARSVISMDELVGETLCRILK